MKKTGRQERGQGPGRRRPGWAWPESTVTAPHQAQPGPWGQAGPLLLKGFGPLQGKRGQNIATPFLSLAYKITAWQVPWSLLEFSGKKNFSLE